ncbi:hypothetical protein HYS49_01720 [Candidatus Woesearchaeota archaeon]|nr:hypothetical protein [Candidatus Woesearchaeota archaeon]
MAYHSPFETLQSAYRLLGSERMRYSGSLENILIQLESIASVPELATADYADFVLHPPRVIRAVVDQKIQSPKHQLEDAVQEAIAYALRAYQEPQKLQAATQAFREYLHTTPHEGMLRSTSISQRHDSTTWDASAPHLSQASALRLARETGNDDVLFIALGHGGVAAGMDVYLRAAKKKRKKSIFYVVRFSTDKHSDYFPRVSVREEKFLREAAERRIPVLFDEDVSTGETMKKAYEFFSDLFDEKGLILLTNCDINGELEKLKKKIKRRMERVNKPQSRSST